VAFLTGPGADFAVDLDVAIEADVVQSGSTPTSEQDLIAGGLVRALFAHHDLSADGTVVLAPDGAC